MKLNGQDTIKRSVAAEASSRSERDQLLTTTVHLPSFSRSCSLHTLQPCLCAGELSTSSMTAAAAAPHGQSHKSHRALTSRVSDAQSPNPNIDSIVVIPTIAAPVAGIMPSLFKHNPPVTSQPPAIAAVTANFMPDQSALGDVLFDSDSSRTSEHPAADNAEELDTIPMGHQTALPAMQGLSDLTARHAADMLKLNLQQSQQELQQWQQDHKDRIAHAFSRCSPTYTEAASAASHSISSSQQLGMVSRHSPVAHQSSTTPHIISPNLQLGTSDSQLAMVHQSGATHSSSSTSSGVRHSAKGSRRHTRSHTRHGGCADQQESVKSKRRLQVFSSQDMNGFFQQQASQPWLQAAAAASADQQAAATLLPVVDELEALADQLPDPFVLPDEAPTGQLEASDPRSTQQAASSAGLNCPVSNAAQAAGHSGIQARGAQRSRLQHSCVSAPAASVGPTACQHSHERNQLQVHAALSQQDHVQLQAVKYSAAQHSMARHNRASEEAFPRQLLAQSQPSADAQQTSAKPADCVHVRSNAAAPSVQLTGWPAAHTAQVHKLRHGSTLRMAAFDAAAKAAALAAKADAEQPTPPCIAFHSRAARHALAAVHAAAAAAAVSGAVSESDAGSSSRGSSQALLPAAALRAGCLSNGQSRLDMLCAQLREDDDGDTVELDAGQTAHPAEWQPAMASNRSLGNCSHHQGLSASRNEDPSRLQRPLLQQQDYKGERCAAERPSHGFRPCQQQERHSHQQQQQQQRAAVHEQVHCDDRHALMQSGNAQQAHQQRHVHWQDECSDAQPQQTAELQPSSSPVQQQSPSEDPFRASLAFPVLRDCADAHCQEAPGAPDNVGCSNGALAADAVQCNGVKSSETNPCKHTECLNEATAQHEDTAQHEGTAQRASTVQHDQNASVALHEMSQDAEAAVEADFATPVRAAELSSLGDQEFWKAARAALLDTAEAVRPPLHAHAVLTPVQMPALASGWNTRHSGITPLIGVKNVSQLKSLSPFVDENMEPLTANWGL